MHTLISPRNLSLRHKNWFSLGKRLFRRRRGDNNNEQAKAITIIFNNSLHGAQQNLYAFDILCVLLFLYLYK